MGAWIETPIYLLNIRSGLSHPTWVRGLKLNESITNWMATDVAPYVGAWIETDKFKVHIVQSFVAPYVGAWIETPI